MAEKYSMKDKAYTLSDGTDLSILDMLGHFHKRGVMRVSDLHIKNCCAPAYRVDGDLVKMKGPAIDEQTARRLIFPLLGSKQIEEYERNFNVDTSYQIGELQFRINVFKERDGISAAERPHVESTRVQDRDRHLRRLGPAGVRRLTRWVPAFR